VADHDLFVDDIGQWKSAEELRERFIDSWIFILGLDFSFETVNVVDLLGLMVSSGHVQKVDVGALPGNEGEDALHRERSPVDKITIEKILVIHGWGPVDLENVNQIKVLPVNVSAYSDLLLVSDVIIYQRLVGFESLPTDLDQLEGVPFVELLLLPKVLHQLKDPQ